jgi:hypothetical protein
MGMPMTTLLTTIQHATYRAVGFQVTRTPWLFPLALAFLVISLTARVLWRCTKILLYCVGVMFLLGAIMQPFSGGSADDDYDDLLL